MRAWPTATTELAPGVFSYVQANGGLCVANAGLIAGRSAVTAIDALFAPDMTRALLDEAARVSAKPIERLVNTHHHVDHTLGNAMFPRDTQIVAHARAREEMRRAGLAALPLIERLAPHFAGKLDGVEERLPDVTFDGATTELLVNDRRLRLMHYGTGHTRGDVIIYLPGERILFTGDLAFFYVTPLAHEGHIGNWIRIVERILGEVDAEHIVPGHGPTGTKDDWRHMLGYLRLVHDGARRAFDAGASEREAIGSIDLVEYAEWVEAARIIPNVARCYQEFRGDLDAI
jgi:glyoxylase-like metal-dependent hydrolase (beta-lactamase superfamily II)